MTFIDSHVHLADPAFDEDRDEVVDRARTAGAIALVCIGESLAAARRAGDLAVAYPGFCFHTAGLHPHDAKFFDRDRDIASLRSELARGAVAVGECGLDYHHQNSPRKNQREAFGAQLDLARELDLPLIVHSREAEDDTLGMIRDVSRTGARGVLHCFTGSHQFARAVLDIGWFVSLSGIITFKSWSDNTLLRLVPDDQLLVETDAPYLAPTPKRGKRNEPSNLPLTIDHLALARGVHPSRLAAQTSTNARSLFRLG